MVAINKESLIEIIEPVAEYQNAKPSTFKHSPRPRILKGKKVALLANFKRMSVIFLENLAQKIARKAELESAFVHSPDWKFFNPERVGKIGPEADELARQCDLIVSGVAD